MIPRPDDKRGGNFKDTKKATMLTELTAKYIAGEAGRSTLITPLRTHLSRDQKHATIFVSVYPNDQGTHAIEFLMRHKDLFRNYLKSRSRFPVLPFIKFEIDYGELNRQHLDEISKDIEIRDEDDEEKTDS